MLFNVNKSIRFDLLLLNHLLGIRIDSMSLILLHNRGSNLIHLLCRRLRESISRNTSGTLNVGNLHLHQLKLQEKLPGHQHNTRLQNHLHTRTLRQKLRELRPVVDLERARSILEKQVVSIGARVILVARQLDVNPVRVNRAVLSRDILHNRRIQSRHHLTGCRLLLQNLVGMGHDVINRHLIQTLDKIHKHTLGLHLLGIRLSGLIVRLEVNTQRNRISEILRVRIRSVLCGIVARKTKRSHHWRRLNQKGLLVIALHNVRSRLLRLVRLDISE